MQIKFETNPKVLSSEAVLKLFENAGISKPNWTSARMKKSLSGSTVIACAYHKEELIGFASAISDRAWTGYLSQLAVNPQHQRKGVGKTLIDMILRDLGDEVTLVLHSADSASDFYHSAGFQPYSNVFVKKRKR